jgi:hypothetical protein
VIVVVSTHLDDAVFSCRTVLAAGADVRVVTVFTAAPHRAGCSSGIRTPTLPTLRRGCASGSTRIGYAGELAKLESSYGAFAAPEHLEHELSTGGPAEIVDFLKAMLFNSDQGQ